MKVALKHKTFVLSIIFAGVPSGFESLPRFLHVNHNLSSECRVSIDDASHHLVESVRNSVTILLPDLLRCEVGGDEGKELLSVSVLQYLDDRVDGVAVVKDLGRLQSDIIDAEDLRGLSLVHRALVLGNLCQPAGRGHADCEGLEQLPLLYCLSSPDSVQILGYRDERMHCRGLAVSAVAAQNDAALGGLPGHSLCDVTKVSEDRLGILALHPSHLDFPLVCHAEQGVGILLGASPSKKLPGSLRLS